MVMPIDVSCPTCGSVSGEHCVVVRLMDRQRGEVVVRPFLHLPGSPHMARREQAKVHGEGR